MSTINRIENKLRKYWIIYYFDDDKKAFNPGVQISDWAIVQEIQRITCALKRDGRKVRICNTPAVFRIDDLLPQEKCVTAGPQGYSYDSFLIW